MYVHVYVVAGERGGRVELGRKTSTNLLRTILLYNVMYASLVSRPLLSFSMSYTEKCVSVCKTETVDIGPVYEATMYIRLSIQRGYNEL